MCVEGRWVGTDTRLEETDKKPQTRGAALKKEGEGGKKVAVTEMKEWSGTARSLVAASV